MTSTLRKEARSELAAAAKFSTSSISVGPVVVEQKTNNSIGDMNVSDFFWCGLRVCVGNESVDTDRPFTARTEKVSRSFGILKIRSCFETFRT